MRLQVFIASSVLLTGSSLVAFGQSTATPSATLTLTEKTEAPGISLSPGTYTVRVEDQLKDRMVIELQKIGSKDATSLLAIPNPGLSESSAPGPIDFGSGLKNKPTLRGFGFGSGTVAEFIYPKKDAVTLATANQVRVMAVDPASQGMSTLPHLSPSDMSEVTLWMLTPSPVEPGSSKPAIQAAHYQPPVPAPAPVQAAPTVAQATPSVSPTPTPAPEPAPAPVVTAAVAAPDTVDSRPAPPKNTTAVASTSVPPRSGIRARALPQTASNLPLLELSGTLSLALALGLRLRSMQRNRG